MIAYDNGINWCHYMEYDLNDDDTITIRSMYRLHKYDDSVHPKWVAPYTLIEGANRIVMSVRIGTKIYIVSNPKTIFDYR